MIYKVLIEETLCKIIEIEASSENEAIERVEKKYYDEEIVLSSENFNDVEIDIYQND